MEITFHEILGSIVLILILIYVVRTLCLLNAEGFETILTTIPTGKDMTNLCPANQTLVYQLLTLASGTTPAKFKYACYSEDVTNVDPTFLNDNLYLYVSTPKDYRVTLYDKKDASGSIVLTLSNSNSMTNDICGDGRYCIGDTTKTPNMKFASIKVTKKTDTVAPPIINTIPQHRPHKKHKKRRNSLSNFYNSSTCPGLTPAAKAAAAAADAKAAADADKAANLALLVSKALAENETSQRLLNDGINLTCPSGGTPVINDTLMRNTKFSAKKSDSKCVESIANEYLFNPDTDT
jgi:hypothetical protein